LDRRLRNLRDLSLRLASRGLSSKIRRSGDSRNVRAVGDRSCLSDEREEVGIELFRVDTVLARSGTQLHGLVKMSDSASGF